MVARGKLRCMRCILYIHVCAQQKEKIVEKAKKTHKQRVEVRRQFNVFSNAQITSAGDEPVSRHSNRTL